MFNPQNYAIRIEELGHFPYQTANTIRHNPIGFLDKNYLDFLEMQSEEKQKEVCAFWDKYQRYNGMSFDDMGEEVAAELVADFKKLCLG